MRLDMLAADHHHHHHSPPGSPQSTAQGSCLAMQMPLSILGSLLRQQTLTPSRLKTDQTEQPVHDADTATTPPSNPSMQPDTGVLSSPTPSRRTSISSGTSTEKLRKRNARSKTTYKLAQPPVPRGKLHIRPKVFLQLHQVVASRRPKPAYEVIPYTVFLPFSTRCKVRTYRERSLHASDLLILKAEEYQQNEEEKTDEERFGSREVVGVICPAKEDKHGTANTEILMSNGQSWEVTRTPSGGYEFVCVDDHGLALRSRWVAKPPHLRRQSTMSNGSQGSPAEDRKFTFSTISQNSRRHPIIATMTRDKIQVSDSYMMPSATSPPTPSGPTVTTPMPTPSSIDMNSFLDSEHLPIETDDALKAFIVASGMWVAFQENWSPVYSLYSKGVPSPLPASGTFKSTPTRTVSMTYIDNPRSGSPVSMTDENKRTIPRMIRSHTQFLHNKSSFPSSTPSSPIGTRARRSNSTGNTDIFRNGSLRKRFGLALEDQPVLETEEERQSKRSAELLRVKELAIQPPPTLTLDDKPLSPIPSVGPPMSPAGPEPSPTLSSTRASKTRSAYDPVTTAGLWDSGVIEGNRTLRTRPTSLVVVNDKKAKAKRKEERSKSRDQHKEKKEKDGRRKSEGLRALFKGVFHKEKITA